MKRTAALLLSLILCAGLLAACGGSSTEKTADSDVTAAPTQAQEIFDTGVISTVIPAGWTAFQPKDVFSDNDELDPNVITICKDYVSEFDAYTKPYIRINYSGPDTTMIAPSKDMYDDVVDMAQQTIGGYTWQGFSCSSIGYKYVILWTGEADGDQIQVSVLYESTAASVSFDDPDVQAIIAGIKVTA